MALLAYASVFEHEHEQYMFNGLNEIMAGMSIYNKKVTTSRKGTFLRLCTRMFDYVGFKIFFGIGCSVRLGGGFLQGAVATGGLLDECQFAVDLRPVCTGKIWDVVRLFWRSGYDGVVVRGEYDRGGSERGGSERGGSERVRKGGGSLG